MRSGADYLASIKDDGRQVYIDGTCVRDVTEHPAFREATRSIAALYDLIDSMARAGFKNILVLNGHGGNVAPCQGIWDQFLQLLVKIRSGCPINGMLLVLPAGGARAGNFGFGVWDAIFVHLEAGGDPISRRARTHRFHGTQIQVTRIPARGELNVLHGRQRNADEQIEAVWDRFREDFDVHVRGQGTIRRVNESTGKKKKDARRGEPANINHRHFWSLHSKSNDV